MFLKNLFLLVLTLIIGTVSITVLLFREDNIFVGLKQSFFSIFLYVTPTILLFGIPVSILVEHVTKNLNTIKRMLASLTLYILFASLFPIIIFIIDGSLFSINDPLHRFLIVGSYTIAILIWIMKEISRTINH